MLYRSVTSENKRQRIVIAPDSFKGSATAAEVAAAIAEGWLSERPDDELLLLPMADGGEGTVDAAALAMAGAERRSVTVSGPAGFPIDVDWLFIPSNTGGGTAVVELASACGIELYDELEPLDAGTESFGFVIGAALDHGVDRLLLAIGGSASTDGGAGALRVLGLEVTSDDGMPVASGNRGLASVVRVDWSACRRPPALGAVILTDVDNPLLGDRGAVAVFGPQKGIAPELTVQAELGLTRWATALDPVNASGFATTPGAGAAGGTGFGLLAWGATIDSGAAAVAAVIGLGDAIASADHVITGEGRFDGQSAAGKAPVEVARLADSAGVGCGLIAGLIDAPTDRFGGAVALAELAGSAEASRAEPLRWLREAGAMLARQA